LLADFGADAKVLAGGQSLVPLLALRLSHPAHLVDIGRIEALRFVDDGPDGLMGWCRCPPRGGGAVSGHRAGCAAGVVVSDASIIASSPSSGRIRSRIRRWISRTWRTITSRTRASLSGK
jgi:hypothetical protein